MLTKTSCYSAVDIVVSVMVYDVETVLVDNWLGCRKIIKFGRAKLG